MEHIAALLLIIGCSDGASQCSELPASVAVYETVEECEADLQPSMSMFKDTRPEIFGQCVTVDPALEEEDAALVWDIKADGKFYASIEIPDVMIASNVDSREKDYVSHE